MKSTKLTSRARELRKNMTPQERKLWHLFLRPHSAHFRRQQPFGPYIADFYCASAKLIIELDGSGHFLPDGLEYDRWRDAFMAGQGFRVLRFTNTQIDNEFTAVCTAINLALSDPLSHGLRRASSPLKGEPGLSSPTIIPQKFKRNEDVP